MLVSAFDSAISGFNVRIDDNPYRVPFPKVGIDNNALRPIRLLKAWPADGDGEILVDTCYRVNQPILGPACGAFVRRISNTSGESAPAIGPLPKNAIPGCIQGTSTCSGFDPNGGEPDPPWPLSEGLGYNQGVHRITGGFAVFITFWRQRNSGSPHVNDLAVTWSIDGANWASVIVSNNAPYPEPLLFEPLRVFSNGSEIIAIGHGLTPDFVGYSEAGIAAYRLGPNSVLQMSRTPYTSPACFQATNFQQAFDECF